MADRDTLIVNLSDMHTGGSTALFPDRFVEFLSGTNHTPTAKQAAMWRHFVYCGEQVAQARQEKRLILVHNGDALDGWHHQTLQTVTRDRNEQIDLHVELMAAFKKMCDYRRGDLLYYTVGTEVHTDDNESRCGELLGAEQTPDDLYAWDELKLTVNGRRLWWVHHGPSAGKGQNRGNGLRNWLRVQFYQAVNEGIEPPDFIITSHTHDPDWQMFNGRYQGRYFPVRGMITPSWQQKTRYGYMRAPLQQGKIGLQYFSVSKTGDISDPVELVMA